MPAQRLRQKQAVRRDRADVKQGLGDGRHDIRAQAPPDRHGGIASAEQGQVALCRGRPWRLSRPHLAPQGRRRHYARACRRAGGAEFEPGDIVRWFRQRDNIAHPQRVAPAAPSQYIRYSCPASSASDRSAEAKPAAVGPHRPRSPGPGTGSLRGSAGATQNVHPLIRRPSAAGLSPPRAGARKVRPGRGFAAASSRALRSGHSARSLAGRRRQAPALGDEKPAGPDLPNSRRCDDTAEPPRACCLRHDRHPLGHSDQRATRSIPRHHRVQRCHAWPSPYNLFAYGRSRAPISGYGLSSGRGRGGGDGHGS